MLVLKTEHIKQFGLEVILYTSTYRIEKGDYGYRNPPFIARNEYYDEEEKIIIGEKFNWFIKKK